MKPTVISSANTSTPTENNGGSASRGIAVPINHEILNSGNGPIGSQDHQQKANIQYGSPKTQSHSREYTQSQPSQHQPSHFQQEFGFGPNMELDMDMFPRSRLGRVRHDPFAGFGGSHFGFPQFGSMGRRRVASGSNNPLDEDDFFNRIPSEFRQYMPEGFGQRRNDGINHMSNPQQQQQNQFYQNQPQTDQHYQQNYGTAESLPVSDGRAAQLTTKKLCDAAIQTDDLNRRFEADSNAVPDNLNQHGLRNTMDMGIKSSAENENLGPRAQSAPPPEHQNLHYQQEQQISANGNRPTAASIYPEHYEAKSNPQFHSSFTRQNPQPTQNQKSYYAQQHQTAFQKQKTPPPSQTPADSYVRTIPIFVEGRSDPIINSHKEIPNQQAGETVQGFSVSPPACAFTLQQQQNQHPQRQRPTMVNTQLDSQFQMNSNAPPQTPHTLDSINKIQNIQRDVLDLMAKVEKFKGTRKDKEYAFLDEMLTRNLLKLDTIDTNGKESIRLARKEAIKCIQASINVLEAKAEENEKSLQSEISTNSVSETNPKSSNDENAANSDTGLIEKAFSNIVLNEPSKIQDPIPLPPPSRIELSQQSQNEELTAESDFSLQPETNELAASISSQTEN